MKRYILYLFIFPLITQAQIRSNLFQKPEVIAEIKTQSKKTDPKRNIKKIKDNPTDNGNLPLYYMGRPVLPTDQSPIVLPISKQSILNNNLLLGEVVTAEIKESLIAFAEAKSPIRAIIESGKLKNSVLVGEATLEKNSKRILILFNKLRSDNSSQTFQLVGNVLDEKGILGIKGTLISGEEKYFAAEFLAGAAAGYADATVEREQNAFGGYTEKPGADTFSKKALSQALSKTATRFAEKLNSVPEYSVLQGPFKILVLITEQPKLIE